MKCFFYQMTLWALLGVIFYGCEPADELNDSHNQESIVVEENEGNKLQEETLPDYFVAQLQKYETAILNSYLLEFTGRNIKGSGDNITTTFNYRVSGTGETPQLDSFTMEVAACAGNLISWTPEQPTTISPGAIKWNNSVSKDGFQEYSLTYKGEVSLGVISSTVTRGSNVQTYSIVGPCKGVYTLAGSIYIDANMNGKKDASESGISDFSITLNDENDLEVGTVKTSADGSYSFMVLAGNYSISVGDDLLNDENYTATGDATINLGAVNQNLSGNNFGYSVNTGKISNELEIGKYNLNTEPTKFWVQQIRNAGKKNNYTEAQINGWLTEIEGLLLSDPFQFGADKRAAALSILTNPIRSDLDEFLQQLLTAELNIVSGRGARNESGELNTGFNRAMLIYAEAVACGERGTCPANDSSRGSLGAQTKAVRSTDTRMLLSFNGSGGI